MPRVVMSAVLGEGVVVAGACLREVLGILVAQWPELEGYLFDGDGGLSPFVSFYVNAEDARFLGGMDASLQDSDVLTIVPAIVGG